MKETEEMQYVCCPKCGTLLFRTSESVAEIICPKCCNIVVARVKFGKVTAYSVRGRLADAASAVSAS